ncbi:MAG TPA: SDR family oxidoreductase [Vicinamibacterales bacterium]|nr:SDR family oxidoreductase [Vicinamibacterales bacterium]
MNLGLKGKVAMVGGGSRGLGFAVARALSAEGAHVSMASRDAAAVKRAADAISRETGADLLAVPTDLRSSDAIGNWHAATVQKFGGVDLLFANTGGPPAGAALTFDDKGWQAAFESLFLSVLRLTRLVVPAMEARGGGSILMDTSSSAKEPIPNLALSNVMRAAVTSLAKTLSLELAKSRIRVNTLIPGRIETDRLRELDNINAARDGVEIEDYRRRTSATVPLGRYGDPDEFGRVAAFLLSDAASYITGAGIQVDGGMIRGL